MLKPMFAYQGGKSYTVAHVMEIFKMKPTIKQFNLLKEVK